MGGAQCLAQHSVGMELKEQCLIQSQHVERERALRQEQQETSRSVWRKEKLRGDSKWPRAAHGKEEKNTANCRHKSIPNRREMENNQLSAKATGSAMECKASLEQKQ